MRKQITITTLLIFCFLLFARQKISLLNPRKSSPAKKSLADTSGKTVLKRFPASAGYERIPADENSFNHYLRNLPLKKHGSPVLLYDGSLKINQDAQDAVVDMDLSKKDL